MTHIQFSGLGLAEPLLRAVVETGYTTPTPIQAKAIPLVLAGGDLLAAAQTGTGKTAGFVLPILHRLHTTEPAGVARAGRPRCLILTPTRELAAQVEESVQTYGKNVPITSMVMFGGVGIQPQIAQLRTRVDILVATPGRLLDHAGQKTVDLSGVEILVLDEGDRMLDMGFIHDIKRILALLPRVRQSMLFSATFSDEVRALANQLLNRPGCVDVSPRNTACELVDQVVHLVPRDHKRDLLSHLIRQNDWKQVLVFTRTKHGANRLAEKLERDGIAASAIHGNKSQGARTRALAQFKAGEVPVLVATDIAARGLDIEELPHVVNFELPNVAEDYVHRIGRTGRAGSSGSAVSLVDPEEIQLLRAIEKLIKRPIERASVEGFVPSKVQPADRDDERPRGHQPRHNQEARSAHRRDSRGERDSRGGHAPRQPSNGRQPRKARESRAPRDSRLPREPRESRGPRDARDSRAPRSDRGPRDSRDSRRHAAAPGRERGGQSRDDSRGNRAPQPRQPGVEVDGNRLTHRPAPVERDGNRLPPGRSDGYGERPVVDDSIGNRVQHPRREDGRRGGGQPKGEVDGNRMPRGRSQGSGRDRGRTGDGHSESDSSEAARHQAQPQPALFSPRPQHRRRG